LPQKINEKCGFSKSKKTLRQTIAGLAQIIVLFLLPRMTS